MIEYFLRPIRACFFVRYSGTDRGGADPELAPKDFIAGIIKARLYLARCNAITISDAGVYRNLRRNGLSRLPGGTRVTMQRLIDEKGRELDEKMKKSDGSIKYAKPGKSNILLSSASSH